MGHVRLGKPPASKRWQEIVSYLAEADVSVGELADAVAGASEKSLARATKDPAFIEALWLLLKIPQAAAPWRHLKFTPEIFRVIKRLNAALRGGGRVWATRGSIVEARGRAKSLVL